MGDRLRAGIIGHTGRGDYGPYPDVAYQWTPEDEVAALRLGEGTADMLKTDAGLLNRSLLGLCTRPDRNTGRKSELPKCMIDILLPEPVLLHLRACGHVVSGVEED